MIAFISCWTDYVASKEDQYLVGFIFVFAIVFNLFVHLYFLFKDVFHNLKLKVKAKFAKDKAESEASESEDFVIERKYTMTPKA